MIDDLIVYRLGDTRYLVVPNASNAPTVSSALGSGSPASMPQLDDASMRTSLVAIQGPRAAEILQPFVDVDLKTIKYYSGTQTTACGVPAILARTGYTGEDGFELFVAWDDAVRVWDTLLEAGASRGLVPAGLGARDTLRLEAGMPLYGQELNRDTTPVRGGAGPRGEASTSPATSWDARHSSTPRTSLARRWSGSRSPVAASPGSDIPFIFPPRRKRAAA